MAAGGSSAPSPSGVGPPPTTRLAEAAVGPRVGRACHRRHPHPAARPRRRGGEAARRAASARRAAPRSRYGGRAPVRARAAPPNTAGRWSLLPDRARRPDAAGRGGRRPAARPSRARDARISCGRRHRWWVRCGVPGALGVRGRGSVPTRLLSWRVSGRPSSRPPGAVDRLRTYAPDPTATAPPHAVVLAVTDPANPYGAALPWPPPPGGRRDRTPPGSQGRRARRARRRRARAVRRAGRAHPAVVGRRPRDARARGAGAGARGQGRLAGPAHRAHRRRRVGARTRLAARERRWSPPASTPPPRASACAPDPASRVPARNVGLAAEFPTFRAGTRRQPARWRVSGRDGR